MTYTNQELAEEYYLTMIDRNMCLTRMSREAYRLRMEKIATFPLDISAFYNEHGSLDTLPYSLLVGSKTRETLEEILRTPKKRPYPRRNNQQKAILKSMRIILD